MLAHSLRKEPWDEVVIRQAGADAMPPAAPPADEGGDALLEVVLEKEKEDEEERDWWEGVGSLSYTGFDSDEQPEMEKDASELSSSASSQPMSETGLSYSAEPPGEPRARVIPGTLQEAGTRDAGLLAGAAGAVGTAGAGAERDLSRGLEGALGRGQRSDERENEAEASAGGGGEGSTALAGCRNPGTRAMPRVLYVSCAGTGGGAGRGAERVAANSAASASSGATGADGADCESYLRARTGDLNSRSGVRVMLLSEPLSVFFLLLANIARQLSLVALPRLQPCSTGFSCIAVHARDYSIVPKVRQRWTTGMLGSAQVCQYYAYFCSCHMQGMLLALMVYQSPTYAPPCQGLHFCAATIAAR
jgi:hypothetical protein